MATLKNVTINDTGYLTISSGTTAQRPSSPSTGMFRYNSDLKINEYYDGTTWINTSPLGSGLFGKRFNGYYADNVSFFASNILQGETNTTTSINNFTSNADSYSWMWLGYFLAPATGTYTFYTSSDDASHLWIGSNAISGYTTANATVNNGGLHGNVEASGTTSLTGGSLNPMRIMFGENGGGDIMTVSFAGPDISKTTNGSGYYYGGVTLWNLYGVS